MKDLSQFVKKSDAVLLFKFFHEAVMHSLIKFDPECHYYPFTIKGTFFSPKTDNNLSSKEANLIHYLLLDTNGREFFRNIIFNLTGFHFRNVDFHASLEHKPYGTVFHFAISVTKKFFSSHLILGYRHSDLYKTFSS